MALKRQPYDLLARHALNDHGRVNSDELTVNIASMLTCGPILSRYPIDPTNPESPCVTILTKESWHETYISVES